MYYKLYYWVIPAYGWIHPQISMNMAKHLMTDFPPSKICTLQHTVMALNTLIDPLFFGHR